VLAPGDRAVRYGAAAADAVAAVGALVRRHPRFAGNWLSAAEAAVRGPLQVAVVGEAPGALLRAARRSAPGGSVVVAGAPDEPGVPLLADRPLVDGGPAAYVCRGFVCDRPVTTEAELANALAKP
jgi:hypothetical protein